MLTKCGLWGVLFCCLAMQALAQSPYALQHIRIRPRNGAVALTFDDGPRPKYTRQILAILDRYHVKATFFVLGASAKRYPELLKAIHNAGHIIANHTMTHPKLTRLPESQYYYQIVKPKQIIKRITGQQVVCLRPPFGLSNAKVRRYIRQQGMQVVMWDLNSFDYKRTGYRKLVNWVLANTRPGYDLLFHDGGGNSFQTVKALPLIIEGLRKRGMRFDVICEPPKAR